MADIHVCPGCGERIDVSSASNGIVVCQFCKNKFKLSHKPVSASGGDEKKLLHHVVDQYEPAQPTHNVAQMPKAMQHVRDKYKREQDEANANRLREESEVETDRKTEKAQSVGTKIPEYTALETMAAFLRILAVIGFVGFVVCFIAALSRFDDHRALVGRGVTDAKSDYLVFASLAVSAAITGFLFLVIAQVIYAFRDMAINSWKQLTVLQSMNGRDDHSRRVQEAPRVDPRGDC